MEKYFSFNDVVLDGINKFNPYHDKRGRFTAAGKESTFTIRTKDPSKQYMADMAIERAKERTENYGKQKGTDSWIKQDVPGLEWNRDWENTYGDATLTIEKIDKFMPSFDKVVEVMQEREEHFSGSTSETPSTGVNFRDGNVALHAIQSVNGFDGYPQVVSHSEYNKIIRGRKANRQNTYDMYKGFRTLREKDGSVKLTGREESVSLIYGDAFAGHGLSGSGIQMTTNKKYAKDYADDSTDSLLRATVKWGTPMTLDSWMNSERDSADFSCEEALKDPNITEAQRTKLTNFRRIVTSDTGNYAALLGFGALVESKAAPGESNIVVLDRGAMIVDESTVDGEK